MITAIQESLARKVPPISFGILGPPEAGIVTGYDQGGAVLYGWSYFQPDRSKYYEKADWFETMDTNGGMVLIVLGDRKPVPTERQVLRQHWSGPSTWSAQASALRCLTM
jgi:hypothetical protein